jgi:hypothetical protein
MTATREPVVPAHGRRRLLHGHLAVVVLVFLVFAGLVLQALVRWTVDDGDAGRAIDRAAQRRVELASLEAIVKESLLLHYESALVGSAPTVAALVDEGLAAITGGAVSRTGLPALPDASPASFQAPLASVAQGASQTLNGVFSAHVDATYPRALRRLDAFRLPHLPSIAVRNATSNTFAFGFQRSTPASTSYQVTARLWLVPVSDFEITAYALPGTGAPPALSALPSLGANALTAPDVRSGLALTGLSSGIGAVTGTSGLPASQRELVSSAGVVWSYVWSAGFRVQLTATLPANHAFAYDSPPEPAAMPGGVVADWDAHRLTVSVGDLAEQGLYLRGSASLLTTVRLQQGGGTASGPVVLYLDGGEGGPNRLQVELASSLTRPCVIYLTHANLVSPGSPRTLLGALFLSPSARVAEGASLAQPLTITGSLAASITAFPNLDAITVQRAASPTWRGRVPRAVLVQADGLVQ